MAVAASSSLLLSDSHPVLIVSNAVCEIVSLAPRVATEVMHKIKVDDVRLIKDVKVVAPFLS